VTALCEADHHRVFWRDENPSFLIGNPLDQESAANPPLVENAIELVCCGGLSLFSSIPGLPALVIKQAVQLSPKRWDRLGVDEDPPVVFLK
jgi:hypothetical protein